MQKDLDSSHPELDIELIGLNPVGQESGNALATEGRDIPWLQDVDANGDGQSDVWLNSWDVEYRDVVIVDEDNTQVGTFNLTTYDLSSSQNYETLRQMLIDTAMAGQEPELEAGDANGDYQFDQLDLFHVLRAAKYDTGESATWEEGDWNGDNVFDRFDVLAALQTANYLQGPYAATTAEAAAGNGLQATADLATADLATADPANADPDDDDVASLLTHDLS
jgi:hypothetical protein